MTTYQERKLARMNSIGTFLRAARNGFFYSDRHRVYLRLSWQDEEKGILLVETCPGAEIRERTTPKVCKTRPNEYIPWDENKSMRDAILVALGLSREHTQNYGRFQYSVNEDGIEAIV